MPRSLTARRHRGTEAAVTSRPPVATEARSSRASSLRSGDSIVKRRPLCRTSLAVFNPYISTSFSSLVSGMSPYGLPSVETLSFLARPVRARRTACARVKELKMPSLNVQSLSHNYDASEQLLQQVFRRARQLRLCVLEPSACAQLYISSCA